MTAPVSSPVSHRGRRWLIAGLIVAAIVAAGAIAYARLSTSVYSTFTRPDGRYQVVVLRRTVWPAAIPGQGGDAPGTVQLRNQGGKILRQADVEMVQLVDQVEWTDRTVHIKLVADWELPD